MGVETSCDRIVRAYTINNARITFEEELKGSIEPGKLADLVILSADYLTVRRARSSGSRRSPP